MKVLKRVLFFDIIHIYYWVIYSCDKKEDKIMIDNIYYNGENEWIRGNKYKSVKDYKSLRNLINTAIYGSTSLLCITNGLLLGW